MALLTKAQILAAEDRRYTTVLVPEWGGEIRLGSMTAMQRQRWASACIAYREEGGASNQCVQALAVLYSVVDEKGLPYFSPEEVVEIQKKDGAVIEFIANEAAKLNALDRKSSEDLKGN